ncbi:hypothetical protein SLEP1_g48829 [Rubroshorea leprosula]|uniref:F-box domain-containing protein n=1 Tax=Rubroshorea leprosula TaxID=152421 RepID=A0AAV5LUW3_9ROSI|nr:hypothetical protein SLEP1_g48829 [Rubroshorea leprosula]
MEEDQDYDYLARRPVHSSDEEGQSYSGFDNSIHGSDDGDELLSHLHSSDEERQNGRNYYFSDSARSDEGDERYRPGSVRSSPKRRKIPEVDRISDLPDSVIHHILSFLPAEDAVKTGVLSKRWMYLWTHAPKLTFRHDLYCSPSTLQGFLRFVDKTLFFYSSGKIEKFELDFDYIEAENDHRLANTTESCLDSLIHKWLRLVTRYDAEELSLNFFQRDRDQYWTLYRLYNRCSIPQFAFNSSSLTKLSTRLCDYAPKGQVCWTSLRVLTIEYGELSNDAIQRILSGSPMLEHMKLHCCWGITSINIGSSSVLEYLEVSNCWPISRIVISPHCRMEKLVLKEQIPEIGESNSVMEILCPTLKSLEISGNWNCTEFRLFNVSSLIDVCLTFQVEVSDLDYVDLLKHLLEKIKHVKIITLGTCCVQVLSILEFRGLPCPFFNSSCECLTLNTDLNKWYPFPAGRLFHCFPTLQKLVIDITDGYDIEEWPNFFLPPNYQEIVDETFHGLFEHLKTIEIGLRPFGDEPDDLALVGFLLENARVLEEMIIDFGCKVSMYRSSEKAILFEVTQKLLRFPRCSPHAAVLIR